MQVETMPTTWKVEFLEDCGVPGESSFKAGQTETMNIASGRHWVRRGKAKWLGGNPDELSGQAPTPDLGPTAKVKFTESRKDKSGEFDFRAGETYELPVPSCERWIKRGVAAYVGAPPVIKSALDYAPVMASKPEPDADDDSEDGETEGNPEPRKRGRPKGVRRGGL